MPSWAKVAVQAWQEAAGIREGHLFRSLNKAGRLAGEKISVQTLWNVVGEYPARTGINVAPHDPRRTHAKLAAMGGAKLGQIQINLGHSSISTTQIYLGNTLVLHDAPCDAWGLQYRRPCQEQVLSSCQAPLALLGTRGGRQHHIPSTCIGRRAFLR